MPATVTGLRLSEITDSQINIRWEESPVARDVRYEVHADSNGDNRFEVIAETEETSFAFEKIEGQRFYTFFIKAVNPCGNSRSAELPVELRLPPVPMIAPTVNPKDCTVQVFWVKPEERGSEITEYKVLVRTKNQEREYEVENCGKNAE